MSGKRVSQPAKVEPPRRASKADGDDDNDDNDKDPTLDARAFAEAIKAQAAAIGLPIKVVIDDDICARVIAGRETIRVREAATFRASDVLGVFVHEVETHALTAQNGAAQPLLPFLAKGGP